MGVKLWISKVDWHDHYLEMPKRYRLQYCPPVIYVQIKHKAFTNRLLDVPCPFK